MKVFFVGVRHGPYSGLVDAPTSDSRYVTKDIHKAKQYYNDVATEIKGGCKQCGGRFEQIESIEKMVPGDHGDFPYWGEEQKCRPILEEVLLVDELDVLPYIQREIDTTFNEKLKKPGFDFFLTSKSDDEMARKNYDFYRKPVKFDH